MQFFNLFNIIVFAFIIVCVSYIGVDLFQRWALEHQLIDLPNSRSSHTQPTARGGGIVVVVLTLLGLGISLLWATTLPKLPYIALLNGGILISVVSWLDDLNPLPARLRFAAHSIASLLVIVALLIANGQSQSLSTSLSVSSIWIGCIFAFIWIVGLTNAYNFMDGIDGIAGLQATIAGIAWTAVGWYIHAPIIMLSGLLIAASSIGFLGHNWSPAKVFMGDVCSAFLGFIFAALPLLAAQVSPKLLIFGLIIVWPFIFDTSFTIIRRAINGENIFQAHRSHLYQRLVILGYTHENVTLLYGGLSTLSAILAFFWYINTVLIGIIVIVSVGAIILHQWVRAEEKRASHFEHQQENLYLKVPPQSAEKVS